MTLLTPWACLAAVAAVLPLGGLAIARRRTAAVRRALSLPSPGSRQHLLAAALVAAGIVLLAIAAAQPALRRGTTVPVRRGVQAVFVVDVSRSMAAAAGPRAPTRLHRALTAAVRLRDAIPGVQAGLLTLTDRVLPDLLPVADRATFAAVADRVVRVESPPPLGSGTRATSFDALSQIAAGNVFSPKARQRIVVLLTDGESLPVDFGALSRALAPAHGYRLLAVRFWNETESVYGPEGSPEAAYRPDPTGGRILRTLTSAMDGRTFDEAELDSAAAALRKLAAAGRTTQVAVAEPAPTVLGPYAAALGLAALLAGLAAVSLTRRSLPSAPR